MTIDVTAGAAGPGARAAHRSAIDDILPRYGLARVAEPVAVADSILNDNYRVETTAGPRFVRVHKPSRTRETVAGEVRMMEHAAARGIPVCLPVRANDGAIVHGSGGLLLSVWPWLDGRTLSRGAVTPPEAAALGDMHGRLDTALADFQDPTLRPGRGGANWDTEASIAMLSRVDDLIRYYAAVPEMQVRVQETIRFRLRFLEGGEARPRADFASLPVQASHGDYHERNVMFAADGSILAVVDWEGRTVVPRVFGLMRAVDFGGVLGTPSLEPYLEGYGKQVRLAPEVCRLGVEMWWQSVLHDTWALRLRFIDGDHRVERFFGEDPERLATLSEPGFRDALAGTLARHLSG
ncbi:MAG: phosphotransferase [Chloroflexi bacterium]|nr:phosphotransferase [Chloroflexota bacterium]